MKIAILGAAGGIGQALALFLKNSLPEDSILSLYDIAPVTIGIATDLSHIPNSISVSGFNGEDAKPALQDADIVLISAGVSRKPGMIRSDLFKLNAGIIQNITNQIALSCPNACIGIITNPVNSMVPIAAKVLKKAGVYNKNKLFGITTLDVYRAQVFIAQSKGIHPENVNVHVIGGHSNTTILPLLSQVDDIQLTEQEQINITEKIRNGGTQVLEAKAGHGSATLSMAHAAGAFTLSLVKALKGEKGIIECAYVESSYQYARFFAQPVLLGKNGIEQYLAIGSLNSYEQSLLDNMLDELRSDISLGEQFVN